MSMNKTWPISNLRLLVASAVISPSLIEVTLLHQGDETRVAAKRVEDSVDLQIHHPLRVGGGRFLEFVERARVIAETQMDFGKISRGDFPLGRRFLELFHCGQGGVSIARRTIGVGKVGNGKWRCLHLRCFL